MTANCDAQLLFLLLNLRN